MTNEGLITKIKTWLEKGEVSDLNIFAKRRTMNQPEPDHICKFHFRKAKMIIFFNYDEKDSFIVTARNRVSKEHQRVQRKRYDSVLLEQMKSDLKRELLTYPAHYDLDFDIEGVLLAVGFQIILWEDGLNQNIFSQALMNVVTSGYRSLNYLDRLFK